MKAFVLAGILSLALLAQASAHGRGAGVFFVPGYGGNFNANFNFSSGYGAGVNGNFNSSAYINAQLRAAQLRDAQLRALRQRQFLYGGAQFAAPNCGGAAFGAFGY